MSHSISLYKLFYNCIFKLREYEIYRKFYFTLCISIASAEVHSQNASIAHFLFINNPEMKGFVIVKIFDPLFSLQNKPIEMTLLQLSRPDDNMWKCKHYCTNKWLNLATLIGFTYESPHTTLNNSNRFSNENISRKTSA